MSHPIMEIVGYVAATLTTIAFLPQLIRIWRLKSATDISASMYTLFIVGLLTWIAYGAAISAWPVVYANTLTAAQAIAILILKARYAMRARA